ncbi:hypothetical protein ACLQ2G_33925, partial [Streptomyces flavovirens]
AAPPDDGTDAAAPWARLSDDPLAERAAAAAGPAPGAGPPGAAVPDERPRALLLDLAAHGEPLTDPLGPGLPEQAAQLAREPLLA